MKVYLAYKWDGYDGRYCMGVFSERALAEKAIETTEHWEKSDRERRERNDWYDSIGRPEEKKGPRHDIEEFELDLIKWGAPR